MPVQGLAGPLREAFDPVIQGIVKTKVIRQFPADEDLTRTGMSEQDRAESLAYLKGLWDGYKAAVGKARNLAPDVMKFRQGPISGAVSYSH